MRKLECPCTQKPAVRKADGRRAGRSGGEVRQRAIYMMDLQRICASHLADTISASLEDHWRLSLMKLSASLGGGVTMSEAQEAAKSEQGGELDELKSIAKEALDSFEAIASAATARLREKGVSLESLANVSLASAEKTAGEMRLINEQRLGDCQHLRREPTIARLVVIDEDEVTRTIYVSPVGTVEARGVNSCSYLSPMGRLASLPIGQGDEIRVEGKRRWYDVLEKMTFQPSQLGGDWDSRPAIHFREKQLPQTIKSLRELLREVGFSPAELDPLAQWLAEEDGVEGDNIVEGIQRDALNAMELRVKAALDQFQDAIMRLPLDSQIAVLGPPGTGKTTTLVKRLRKTLDFQHIEVEERELVRDPDDRGLDHADSWIMFTPTELLRLYVKEGFGKQGVPIHDERIWTWDAYREEIGKNALRFLRTASQGGMSVNHASTSLLQQTLQNQIEWFEAFDAFQNEAFVRQLAVEAERLVKADQPRFTLIGRRVLSALERSAGKPIQLVGELVGFSDELRSAASEGNAEIQVVLGQPLQEYAKADPEFLNALMQFVAALSAADPVEDGDDDSEDEDDEADDGLPLSGRKMAMETFRRAMRARAIAQAAGRTLGAKSRAGRLLAFLGGRGLELPDLKDVGGRLLVRRAAGRIARAPSTWLSGIPLRYRQFRRAMRAEGLWYSDTLGNANEVHPAETDLVLLAILSQARAMSGNTLLRNRLGEQTSPMLTAAARLRRNQVLVDEATDFSPLQLAIMRNLTDLRTNAIFVSGDFNQRLTKWGSRSEADLLWAVPNVEIRPIAISYRQSRELAEFAVKLASLLGMEVNEKASEEYTNRGFAPVLGCGLADVAQLASWLGARIREIETLSNGILPTIAVLVDNENRLGPLAEALNLELAPLNIRADPCFKGKSKGIDGHVRIFDVQHIKGLEFEAVFFVNVDELAEVKPDLFDRYVYVGATRAATFLGLTSGGSALPQVLEELRPALNDKWSC